MTKEPTLLVLDTAQASKAITSLLTDLSLESSAKQRALNTFAHALFGPKVNWGSLINQKNGLNIAPGISAEITRKLKEALSNQDEPQASVTSLESVCGSFAVTFEAGLPSPHFKIWNRDEKISGKVYTFHLYPLLRHIFGLPLKKHDPQAKTEIENWSALQSNPHAHAALDAIKLTAKDFYLHFVDDSKVCDAFRHALALHSHFFEKQTKSYARVAELPKDHPIRRRIKQGIEIQQFLFYDPFEMEFRVELDGIQHIYDIVDEVSWVIMRDETNIFEELLSIQHDLDADVSMNRLRIQGSVRQIHRRVDPDLKDQGPLFDTSSFGPFTARQAEDPNFITLDYMGRSFDISALFVLRKIHNIPLSIFESEDDWNRFLGYHRILNEASETALFYSRIEAHALQRFQWYLHSMPGIEHVDPWSGEARRILLTSNNPFLG